MIKITNQTNTNECGICVLKSLIQHYHKKDVSMGELLTKAHLNGNGLSIYDLETLGYEYGINFESYELTFDELIAYPNNKHFVLIIQNTGLHYVIAKKHKKYIEIFCSEKGYYKLSYEELKHVWINILIECNKAVIKNNQNKSQWECRTVNWAFLLLCNLINIVILIVSLFNATFFDKLINLTIENGVLRNITFIILIYFSTYCLKLIGDTLINIICFNKSYQQYQWIHFKALYFLKMKRGSFFNKLDIGHLHNIDNYLFSAVGFYNIHLNRFICDTLLILGTSFFIFFMNIYIGLISIGIVLLIIVIETIKYFYQKQQIPKFEKQQNTYNASLYILLDEIKNSHSYTNKNLLVSIIKNNFSDLKNIVKRNFSINTNYELLGSILEKILFFIIIIIGCHFIVNEQIITISKLSIILSLIYMQSASARNILNILKQYEIFKYAQDIVNKVINVDNYDHHCGIGEINQLQCLKFNSYNLFNDTFVHGESGVGKTTMLKKILSTINNDNDQIYFNDIQNNLISNNVYLEQMIYLNNESCLYEQQITELLQLNNPFINNLISKLKIKDLANLSTGQKQCLLFLTLLTYQNKIILLDELLSNVSLDIKQLLLKNVKPKIVENNFLIYVGHELQLGKYFKKQVEYA